MPSKLDVVDLDVATVLVAHFPRQLQSNLAIVTLEGYFISQMNL